VLAAMNTLQTEQRQAIELAYFEGLKQSEIAAKLASSGDGKDLDPKRTTALTRTGQMLWLLPF
jgi:hypothetical protein